MSKNTLPEDSAERVRLVRPWNVDVIFEFYSLPSRDSQRTTMGGRERTEAVLPGRVLSPAFITTATCCVIVHPGRSVCVILRNILLLWLLLYDTAGFLNRVNVTC